MASSSPASSGLCAENAGWSCLGHLLHPFPSGVEEEWDGGLSPAPLRGSARPGSLAGWRREGRSETGWGAGRGPLLGTREPKRCPCKIVLDVGERCFPLSAIPSKGEREKSTENKGTALGVVGKGKASSRELWFFPDLGRGERCSVRGGIFSRGQFPRIAAFQRKSRKLGSL